jgi:hypothetical protein
MRTWRLRSLGIDEVVQAEDQFEAWDMLSDRPVEDFGLVVVAEPDEDADPIPVQTETLMRRWERNADAELFHALAVAHGLKESA